MLTILIGMRQEMAAIKNTVIQSGQLSVAIAAHAAQRADLQLIGSLIAPFLASRFTAADVTNDVRRVERIIIEPVRPGEFVDPDTGTVQRKPDRGHHIERDCVDPDPVAECRARIDDNPQPRAHNVAIFGRQGRSE